MDESLLDSDILSEILKAKDRRVLDAARRYLGEHSRLAFSAMTLYEILRGLQASGATRGLARFLQLVEDSDVLPISIPVLKRAADLWSVAYRGGHPRGDADLLIAATALESGRVLVTGNTVHFTWIPGLAVSDWRAGAT
jgi:tRNA(fMet)-specific endonuclease VapC